MKTLRLLGMALIALFVSVSFSACSSDDDENQPSSNPLIDTWVGENVINVPTVGYITYVHNITLKPDKTGTFLCYDKQEDNNNPSKPFTYKTYKRPSSNYDDDYKNVLSLTWINRIDGDSLLLEYTINKDELILKQIESVGHTGLAPLALFTDQFILKRQ